MTLDLINFVHNTKIKASEVNTNFSLLNDELSITQGTVEQLNSTVSTGTVPVGAVFWFAGSSVPDGYLLCDGSAVSRSTYATLYTKIGTTYGAGDGTTTFNVPKLTDNRFIKGSTTAGTAADAVLGTHTHSASIDNGGSHQHSFTYFAGHSSGLAGVGSGGLIDGLTTSDGTTYGNDGTHNHGININNAGSGENAPKSLTLLPCIKAIN